MEDKINEILKENNYTVDYLSDGSPIFQRKDLYTFSSDSVALAKYVNEEEIGTLVDLCSGSGIVGFEVIGKIKTDKIIMVEIQEPLSVMARESAKLNKTKTKIEVLNINLAEATCHIEEGSVDVITVNPPYFKKGSGLAPEDVSRALARHEIATSLEEIIDVSSKILKPGGKLYMVHIKQREGEIIKELTKRGFSLVSKSCLSGGLERVIIEAVKTK